LGSEINGAFLEKTRFFEGHSAGFEQKQNRWIGPQRKGRYETIVMKKEGTRERTPDAMEENKQKSCR
jgi:hypothetical protein